MVERGSTRRGRAHVPRRLDGDVAEFKTTRHATNFSRDRQRKTNRRYSAWSHWKVGREVVQRIRVPRRATASPPTLKYKAERASTPTALSLLQNGAETQARAHPAAIVYHEPKVMAEIGCNHMGQLEIAKELLRWRRTAAASTASSRSGARRAAHPREYAAPTNPHNSYGDTYGAHREFLELTVDQHRELKEHRDTIGLGYRARWDMTSAKEIVSLKPT